MIILNFSHPLTEKNLAEVEALTNINQELIEIIDIPTQFNPEENFIQQTKALVNQIPFDLNHWHIQPILVNPPAYNWIALALITELHGRIGGFPTIMRLCPIITDLSTTYQVQEIINLQEVRENSRKERL